MGKLQELGYSRKDSELALASCDGNVNRSAMWLVENSTPVPGGSRKAPDEDLSITAIDVIISDEDLSITAIDVIISDSNLDWLKEVILLDKKVTELTVLTLSLGEYSWFGLAVHLSRHSSFWL